MMNIIHLTGRDIKGINYKMTSLYFSYLLRIWKSENDPPSQWFASLEAPTSREVIFFRNIEELMEFIRTRLDNSKTHTEIPDHHKLV